MTSVVGRYTILEMFGTGYNPRSQVMGTKTAKKTNTREVNGEEAFRLYDERGIWSENCTEPARFEELIEKKANMTLSINLWKESWLSVWREDATRVLGYLELSELMESFPATWIEERGLFSCMKLTPKDVYDAYRVDLSGLWGEGI